MKSVFAIKKDALLRIIEASEGYERQIADNAAPIDIVMDSVALIELEKCGYIIRIPVTDLAPVEWAGMGYALVEVVVLPAVVETLSAIDLAARVDQVHIETFAPGNTDIEMDGDVILSSVKMLYFTISGDIEADDYLQAQIVRVLPYELTQDVEIDSPATAAHVDVVGITIDQVMQLLDGVEASINKVVGISLKQDVDIDDIATIEGAAVAGGLELIQDVGADAQITLALLAIQPFNVQQDVGLDLVYRLDPRKAKYLVLVHDVAIDGSISYAMVDVAGLAAVETLEMDDSCVVSVERSAVFGDYANLTFGDLANKTFNELRRIVV